MFSIAAAIDVFLAYLGETCDITVGCAIRGVLGEVAPVCINGLCVCDEAARQISATYDDKDYCTGRFQDGK